jgi:asparagine synthase (glutamine-hydrolysing)
MCGIAGIVGGGPPDVAESALRAMVGAIAHRGPDGEGMEHWPNAHLGHRRLAILDLSDAGRQPMLSDDGQIGIVFNGCIFNFMEIRHELEQRGHRFRSHCDTEVLVRGYQEWGIDALVSRLRGMFAFGIWDNPRKTLTLVRDRLGVKPLMYSIFSGGIAFASTVPALRDAGLVGNLDPMSVLQYLEFGYVIDERTIYQGASKLPAAHILEWNDGKSSLRPYWKLPAVDAGSRITFNEAVEETERLIVESVKLRLVSDVPIGALLSGGIDSTLICWALSKLNANITAFTVSTPNDKVDEAPATLVTAKLLGIPHKIVTLPNKGYEMLETLVSAFGEPFGATSASAMIQVSGAVKPHATVLLTGDGGDDLFLGYDFQRDYYRIERLARMLPSFAGPMWRTVRPLAEAIPALRRPKHLLNYATGGLPELARAHDGLPYYEARGMLGKRLKGLVLEQRTMLPSSQSAKRLLTDYLDYLRRMWFVSEFMTKVDSGTMYHALEARSPLLDQKLWEFGATLPHSLRFHGGELKAILRQIVRRRVSPEVASRKKQGFTIPIERWLLGDWSGVLDGMEGGSLIESGGWIEPGTLRTAIREAKEKRHVPLQMWYLVVLEYWLRRHHG